MFLSTVTLGYGCHLAANIVDERHHSHILQIGLGAHVMQVIGGSRGFGIRLPRRWHTTAIVDSLRKWFIGEVVIRQQMLLGLIVKLFGLRWCLLTKSSCQRFV